MHGGGMEFFYSLPFFCIFEMIFSLKQKLVLKDSSFKSIRGSKSSFFPAHITAIEIYIVNSMKNNSTGLDQFSTTYDNLILTENFNVS